MWGVPAYRVTIGETSQGKARKFVFCSAGNYGHVSREDIGVLALNLGGNKAIMKNYGPKSQEGFRGVTRKTWSQSSRACPPPALGTNTICIGGIIKQLLWFSRNDLNKKESKNKPETKLKTNQLEEKSQRTFFCSHVHIPLLKSIKGLQNKWSFSVNSAHIPAHMYYLRADLRLCSGQFNK